MAKKTPIPKDELPTRAKNLQWKLCVNVEFSKEDLKKTYKIITSRTHIDETEFGYLIKKLQKGVVTSGYLDGRREVLFLKGNPPKYFFHSEEQYPFEYATERK